MKRYRIYQTEDRNWSYMDLEFAKNHGFDITHYNLVCEYEGEDNIVKELEVIFTKGNFGELKPLEGTRMHSLSVSDIIEVDGSYYYCQPFGFEEL